MMINFVGQDSLYGGIYAICVDDVIRYVGMTTTSFELRCYFHNEALNHPAEHTYDESRIYPYLRKCYGAKLTMIVLARAHFQHRLWFYRLMERHFIKVYKPNLKQTEGVIKSYYLSHHKNRLRAKKFKLRHKL